MDDIQLTCVMFLLAIFSAFGCRWWYKKYRVSKNNNTRIRPEWIEFPVENVQGQYVYLVATKADARQELDTDNPIKYKFQFMILHGTKFKKDLNGETIHLSKNNMEEQLKFWCKDNKLQLKRYATEENAILVGAYKDE